MKEHLHTRAANSASLFEHDTPENFGYAGLQRHLAANTGAPVLLAQALHAHRAAVDAEAAADAVVVNLLDQKLWNLNPDFFSYTLSKAALHAATTMLAQHFESTTRICMEAGLTDSPGLSRAA